MVRKGSRRIVVDGMAYRWQFRVRPTYFQGLAWSPCTFADAPGTTLVVTTGEPHSSNWLGREATPVLPSAVAAAVWLALCAGWTPRAPGSMFRPPPRYRGVNRGTPRQPTCDDGTGALRSVLQPESYRRFQRSRNTCQCHPTVFPGEDCLRFWNSSYLAVKT